MSSIEELKKDLRKVPVPKISKKEIQEMDPEEGLEKSITEKKVVKPSKAKSKITKSVKKVGKERSFALLLKSGKRKGRYISKSPLNAGKKIFTKLGVNHAIFSVIETTSGSKKKVFRYEGTRKNTPKTVKRQGKDITYKYTSQVKSYKGDKSNTV